MKRIFAAVITVSLLLCLFLTSCSNDSFVLVYYETYELMSDALSFTMETLPDEDENVIIYGGMDNGLGQIKYSVLNEGERMNGTLVLRMATLSYAEKYTTDAAPGIAGVEASSPTHTEKLGVYDVTYYVNGATVFAVWNEGEFAYSIAFTFTDTTVTPTYEDLRPYVIALIATT